MLTWLKGNLVLLKVSLVIAALIAAWINGSNSGQKYVERKWEQAKIADKEAQKKAIEDALFELANEYERQLRVNRTVIEGYQNDIKASRADIARERAINDDYRMRFRAERKVPGPATGSEAPGTGGADGTATEYIELPAPIAGGLRAIAESADIEVSTCVTRLTALQKWIRDNGFYEQDNGTIPVPTNTQE